MSYTVCGPLGCIVIHGRYVPGKVIQDEDGQLRFTRDPAAVDVRQVRRLRRARLAAKKQPPALDLTRQEMQSLRAWRRVSNGLGQAYFQEYLPIYTPKGWIWSYGQLRIKPPEGHREQDIPEAGVKEMLGQPVREEDIYSKLQELVEPPDWRPPELTPEDYYQLRRKGPVAKPGPEPAPPVRFVPHDDPRLQLGRPTPRQDGSIGWSR
jgi:hypothetical protein